MSSDPMQLAEPNPLTTKTCKQLEDMDNYDEDGEFVGESQDECGRTLVFERHGNEVVYMCTEHGWQATEFEDGSGDK
jgi:hypothetical protein